MRIYPEQVPGCAAVSASGGAIDPKTHQKWVWAYIKAVAELVDKVVSLFILILNFILVSGRPSLSHH